MSAEADWPAPDPPPAAYFGLFNLIMLPTCGLKEFPDAFSPASDPAIWLIFAGMVIAVGLRKTTLNQRLAVALIRQSKSKFEFVINACVLGWMLAFMIPSSTVRALLVSEMARTILDKLQYHDEFPSPHSKLVHLSLLMSTVNTGYGFLTGACSRARCLGGAATMRRL